MIIYTLIFIDIISVGCLYYTAIDWQIRKVAKSGAFSRKELSTTNQFPLCATIPCFAIMIIGFVMLLCAVMIPMANGLFYRSSYRFFSEQMRNNAVSLAFPF